MKKWLIPFLGLSIFGLIASIVVHLLAIINAPIPFEKNTWLLHMGIFIVWLPTIIMGNQTTGNFPRKDFWESSLRGAPRWVKPIITIFGAYTLINFLIFIILTFNIDPKNVPESVKLRGFSGHWMLFYSAASAILYSEIRLTSSTKKNTCPNGHKVSPTASFCETCGISTTDS